MLASHLTCKRRQMVNGQNYDGRRNLYGSHMDPIWDLTSHGGRKIHMGSYMESEMGPHIPKLCIYIYI